MGHVCPWWGGYFIDNPLRRLLHNPEKILAPYLRPGMTVVDIGCGMGIFSIAAAKLVGDQGRVIAVDLQQQMLDVLRKRAEKAGVAGRIQLQRCEATRLGVAGPADFALAFAMVHEVPDRQSLLQEVHCLLRPGAKFLVAEPRIHVSNRFFQETLAMAGEIGLRVEAEPSIRRCHAALLRAESPAMRPPNQGNDRRGSNTSGGMTTSCA